MGDILAHFHIAGILLVSKHLLKSIVNVYASLLDQRMI